MLIKLVLLFFTITATVASSVEVKKKPSGESTNIEYEISDTVSVLRVKLQSENFISNSTSDWAFIQKDGKNRVSNEFETYLPVNTLKNDANIIFIESTGVPVLKLCFTTKLNDCKNLDMSSDTKLSDLRDTLKTTNVIEDNDCSDWRFIKSKANIKEANGKLTVEQKFIIDKSIESELTLNTAIFENVHIRMLNLYDVNLEKVSVMQALTEHQITINPVVSLYWLRQILSKKLTCPNASWKGPNKSILDESGESKWRVIVRNINSADAAAPTGPDGVSSDLLVAVGEEPNIKVNSKIYVNRMKQNFIDYSNIRSKKPDFIGMRIQNFTGPDNTMIRVIKKYPSDDYLKPIMLSNIRSVNQQNFEYRNAVIAENGTAVAFVITHPRYDKMYLDLFDGNQLITYGIGNYMSFYASSLKDILITKNENQGNNGDRLRSQEITVKMSPITRYQVCKKSVSVTNHNHELTNGLNYTPNDHFPPGSVNQAELNEGEYQPTNRFSSDIPCNLLYGESLYFKFHIFNFVSRDIAEKLLAMEPTEAF